MRAEAKNSKFFFMRNMNFWFVSFSKSVKVSVPVHWWKYVNNLVISRTELSPSVSVYELTYESCLSSMENVRPLPTGETGKCQKMKWIRIQYSRYNRYFNVCHLVEWKTKTWFYSSVKTKINKHHPLHFHNFFELFFLLSFVIKTKKYKMWLENLVKRYFEKFNEICLILSRSRQ